MNYKRKQCDEEDAPPIDLPFLVNQRRAISEQEFKLCLPQLSYEQYINIFFKRRIGDMLKEYKDKDWFINRYLNTEKQDFNGQLNDNIDEVIAVKDIYFDFKIKDTVAAIKNVENVLISQNGKFSNFTVDFYIIPKSKNTINEIIEALKTVFDTKAEIINLSELTVKENAPCTSRQLQRIFTELCNLSDVDEKSVKDEVSGESAKDLISNAEYLKILRSKFNFCAVCCNQYDNPIQMKIACSTHGNFSERSLDLLGYPKNFEAFFGKNQDLSKFYSTTPEMNFRCNKCNKVFRSVDCVTLHITKKHDESGGDETMNTFLKNIDLFFISLCLGTDDYRVPSFFKSPINERSVIYDMPLIYSGNFELN